MRRINCSCQDWAVLAEWFRPAVLQYALQWSQSPLTDIDSAVSLFPQGFELLLYAGSFMQKFKKAKHTLRAALAETDKQKQKNYSRI